MKLKNWLPVFSVFGILLLLNILSQRFYARLDLTQEGKYTLTPATKKVLQQLDDIVFIKVYLEGDFPAGFKRLRNSTQDMLDEFRAIAGNNLQYEFIDPLDVESESEKQAIANQLI
ncbi:MAG: Gldg family protein [Sphingobacteriales bacterium]|nr:Gldg family protein [Sphingobacteriales bacterium]